jgi:hypothetical protein
VSIWVLLALPAHTDCDDPRHNNQPNRPGSGNEATDVAAQRDDVCTRRMPPSNEDRVLAGDLPSLLVVHRILPRAPAGVVLELVFDRLPQLGLPIVRTFLFPHCSKGAVVEGDFGDADGSGWVPARRDIRAQQRLAAVVARRNAGIDDERHMLGLVTGEALEERPRSLVKRVEFGE